MEKTTEKHSAKSVCLTRAKKNFVSRSRTIETIQFFHEPKVASLKVQEFEVRIDYRPISLYFRELGLERSWTSEVKATSEMKAQEMALISFRKIYSPERAQVLGLTVE